MDSDNSPSEGTSSHADMSTRSACLDFSFGALQHTPENRICELLVRAWAEDSTLTLKLIFQLRDIRHGKGAMIEFHNCLKWLFNNHPNTLLINLEFIARHGYWKDLSWLIKFLLEGVVAVNSKKPEQTKKQGHGAEKGEHHDLPLEELIRKRVKGEVDRGAWKKYLRELKNDEARKDAREKFHKIAKEVHKEQSQKAKETKKKAKQDASLRLTDFIKRNEHFERLYGKVVELFASALERDRDALLSKQNLNIDATVGKWAPRIGGSIDNATSLASAIARKLYLSRNGLDDSNNASAMDENDLDNKAFAYYRKHYVSPLRHELKVPERFMSANKWGDIEYQRVSSVCMKRNKKHFLSHDPDRFKAYLNEVVRGEKKIASGALMPHEIVRNFLLPSDESPELEQVSELQWKSYVDNMKKSGTLTSALAVCDVSASMTGIPMEVAIALSLLTSEVSKPPFHELICTFSDKPILMTVNQKTLKEKIRFIRNMEWGTNTNLQGVFDRILEVARKTKLPPSEMVKNVFIYSDMEFDNACGHQNTSETDFQIIKRKFIESGYPVPGMVFWNLAGDRSKPVTKEEHNVALVSGFSAQMLKYFLENGEFKFENPYQVMLASLGNRYDHLKVVD